MNTKRNSKYYIKAPLEYEQGFLLSTTTFGIYIHKLSNISEAESLDVDTKSDDVDIALGWQCFYFQH